MIECSPWLLGHGALLSAAQKKCEAAGLEPRVFEVLDPASQAFFSLLNAANQVAFGGLGMPAWVQLDCCTLPGLMVGWGGAPDKLPPKLQGQVQATLRDRLVAGSNPSPADPSAPLQGLDYWPYSEFCGIRRGDDELVGVSTFSLVARQGLGLRAKALGLWLSQAKTQIGMTQWDNAAAALHARFGPLRIIAAQTANHSRPAQTFVYSLELPSQDQLLAMLLGQKTRADVLARSANEALALSDQTGAQVQRWLDAGQRVHLVGWTPQTLSFHRGG